MFHNYPKRNTYRLTIKTYYGDLTVRYKQATAQETFEYWEEIQAGRITEYRIKFIEKHTIGYNKKRYITKSKVLQETKKKLDEFILQMDTSYHKRWESIYKGLPKAHNKDAKPNYFDQSPFVLSKVTGVSVDVLHDSFTLEQIEWMYDKLLHDYYWTFKAGEMVNNMAQAKRPKTEQEIREHQRKVEEVKKALPKGLYDTYEKQKQEKREQQEREERAEREKNI